ncbi:hypothetical protein SEUCBS139899_004181 [Sporothrix eucalyptigena]|uniref:HNH nuclease domain-containing protein n=1 Tax=Sporothrix eucalyptigena TaxID=1812306 RepID=A0ABP0B0H3_9PEZI
METPAVSMDELGKTVNTGDNDDNSDRGSTTAKGKGKAEGSGASVASTTNIVTMDTKGRGTGDKTAQRVVPTWYGQRCVLSGLIQPQGAHIVPVQDELVVRGREVTNIVPLCPDGHLLWDRYCFALRPITHPDPHRMYVQIVWLTDVDTDGGLVASRWNHDVGGSIVDFRRGQPRYSSDGSRGNDGNWYPPIRHGDVYELTTADPVAQPLPSFRLLEIQFAVHKLISGMCAAGAVRTIFGGDPPDDTSPPVPAGLQLPPMWRAALDAAVDAGVLNTAASDRWEKAVIQHHYRLLDSQGDGDDSEGSIIA